jgi:hypothetical protein
MYSPVTFETTHRFVKLRINEPVERGHWRTVAQVGFVLDDDGLTVFSTYNNGESSRKGTAEESFDDLLVVR